MSQEPKVTRFGALPLIDSELATKAYVDGSSGGGQTFARVVKTVDEIINNSTTFQDDDELLFTPQINNEYAGFIMVVYAATAVANWKSRVTLPAGATGFWKPNGNDWNTNGVPVANITSGFGIGGSGAADQRFFEEHFMIRMGATAGDINFQWAQNTLEATDATVFSGSLLVVWENV